MPGLTSPVGIPGILTWVLTWLLGLGFHFHKQMRSNAGQLSKTEPRREERDKWTERNSSCPHVEFAGALSLQRLNHKKPLHTKWELRSPGMNISQHGSKPYKNRGSITTLLIFLDNLGCHIGWIWNQRRDMRLGEFLRRFSEGGMKGQDSSFRVGATCISSDKGNPRGKLWLFVYWVSFFFQLKIFSFYNRFWSLFLFPQLLPDSPHFPTLQTPHLLSLF